MSHPDPTQRLPSVLSRYMLLIALVLVMLPHFLPLPVWLSARLRGRHPLARHA